MQILRRKIASNAVVCTNCGRQVEEIGAQQAQSPNIIINNTNTNVNRNVGVMAGKPKNKWVAITLCLLVGVLGGHKFYEGKTGMGILYMFTGGLFVIGVVVDFIALLSKPNPYYV